MGGFGLAVQQKLDLMKKRECELITFSCLPGYPPERREGKTK